MPQPVPVRNLIEMVRYRPSSTIAVTNRGADTYAALKPLATAADTRVLKGV